MNLSPPTTPPAETLALKIVIAHLLSAMTQVAGGKWLGDTRASCLAAVEIATVQSNTSIDERALRDQTASILVQVFDGVEADHGYRHRDGPNLKR